MTTATKAWARKWTAIERRALNVIVDKLLEARLGYSGKDSQEQREFTMTWAEVFLQALLDDKKAAQAVVRALQWTTWMPSPSELVAANRRLRHTGVLVEEPEDEKTRLVRDIRRMVPLLAIEYPELAAEIDRAMDMVDETAPEREPHGRSTSSPRMTSPSVHGPRK